MIGEDPLDLPLAIIVSLLLVREGVQLVKYLVARMNGQRSAPHNPGPGALHEKLSEIEQRLKDVERRMDKAGNKLSELASEVQGLPERLRGIFLPLDRAHDLVEESKVDRTRLWAELAKLREAR